MISMRIYLFSIIFLTIFNQTIAYAVPNDSYICRVAVVDVESILEHSIAVNSIRKSINEISSQIQKELSAKELELKNIEGELIKKRGILSESEFDSKVTEFNKRVNETQKEMQIKKNALEQAHSEAVQQVHHTTISIISDLAKKYDLNMVLPSSQVLFVDNKLNITLEVITSLNERLKSVEVKYNK